MYCTYLKGVTWGFFMISICTALPPPTVTIASRQPSADGCGEVRILNCTTELMDGFITTPSISWIAPDGTSVSTEGRSNPRLDNQTKQLIFSDISAASPGVYMCRLGVGISFEVFTGVDIDAQCEIFVII